jgi:hypothetical protein
MNEEIKIVNSKTKTITFPKIMCAGQKIIVNNRTFCAIQLGNLMNIHNTLIPALGWVEIFEQIEVENKDD